MLLMQAINSLCNPLKKEVAFFMFFLLAIMIIPIRIFVADIHYLNFQEIFAFLFVNLPRAIVISYAVTVFVIYAGAVAKMGGVCLCNFAICGVFVSQFGFQ